jgi:MFS family permease
MGQPHQAAPNRTTGRGTLLAMLLIAYSFNFVDRQILGILIGPIKAELNLSDTQLGLLGGIAFALFYSSVAIPVAIFADRKGRSGTIAVSLALWSGFTALCGMATSFWQLFLCRLGVGIGEAGGVAPSYALIADSFPPERRARALAIFSLGIPLGSAAGVLFGGLVAASFGWRSAFVAVGLAGLAFAPVFRWLVRDAPRVENAPAAPPVKEVWGSLKAKPSFWLLAFGAASSSMLGYGVAFWLPQLLQRSFGLDLVQTSQFYGAILLIGGVAGVLLGGWLGDRAGAKDKAGYARLPAIAFVLAVPLYALAIYGGSATVAFPLFVLCQALAYIWLGPVIAAVQHLVPLPRRATASAVFLFVNNLIGIGAGTLVMGALSDALTPRLGDEALRVSMLVSLSFYLVAAALMWLASRRLAREWDE